MSQKWVRAKQWDDRNLPATFDPARYWIGRFGRARFFAGLVIAGAAYAALWVFAVRPVIGASLAPSAGWLLPAAVALYLVWPVKFVMRAISSIPLAVVLLTFVAIYGTLASVTIGLLVQIPTYLLYGLTALLAIVVFAALPAWLTVRGLKKAGAGRAGRFVVGFLGVQVLGLASVWLWYHFAWPAMRYNPGEGTGFMLFAETVEKYRTVTLRRLPGIEMSELEFYGWWPLRVVLMLFILNMVMATVRRIEFSFPNIGVLTVHTGIVTIALGSVYYQKLKVEGDMLLLAGPPDDRGIATAGPPEGGFYDNTEVVLWVAQPMTGVPRRPEQRLLRDLPRYNDYNLNALGLRGQFEEAATAWDEGRTLDITPARMTRSDAAVEGDLDFRVVGYANYAELVKQTVPAPMPNDVSRAQPSRQIVLFSALPEGFVPGPNQPRPTPAEPRAVFAEQVGPAAPASRVLMVGDSLGVEYTRGMSEQRWNELRTPIPAWAGQGAGHALIVEVPGAPGSGAPAFRQVYAIDKGTRLSIGNTGYTIEVNELAPEPPMPLVTPGYERANSSLAVVNVTPPALADGTLPPSFDRWIYSRFPEISQDLLGERGPNGMPRRRAADPGIRISYIDASIVQVYFDEQPGGDPENPPVRALVRLPGRNASEISAMHTGERVQIDEMALIGLGARIANVVQVEYPVPTPEERRDKQAIGTHTKGAIAVQVRPKVAAGETPAWTRTLWVPFSKYLLVDPSLERSVTLPDGRRIEFVFGRRWRNLPEMALRLTKFDMIPFDHSDIPRDYRSDVTVMSWWKDGSENAREQAKPREEPRHTSLNDPLLVYVPFKAHEGASGVVNAVGWALSAIAPEWYKFSQAGWDSDGWTRSKALVEQGRLDRPTARFTILGVGNNPGITIIAAGAVMMSVGIPWAFYVKPMIMRGRKRRLQRELAAAAGSVGTGGTGGAGGAGGAAGTGQNGTAVNGHAPARGAGVGAEAGS